MCVWMEGVKRGVKEQGGEWGCAEDAEFIGKVGGVYCVK